MKLVAFRQRDIADIVALAGQLNLLEAPPEAFTRLLFDVYGNGDSLAMAAGVPDSELAEELDSRSRWAVTEINRTQES